MANAMKPSDIDFSKISFSALKALENGGKMIYLNYDGGINPLYIQTPEGELPFDPNYFADDGKDDGSSLSGKYSINMSIKVDSSKSMKAFHDVFVKLDEFIMAAAKENSQAWFKKAKISEETISELYTRQVKVSIDSETGEPNGMYPPKFTYKVVKRDGKFQNFKIYDNEKNVFDVNKSTDEPVDFSNVVMKGTRVKAVLKCNGIWIANGKFGCTWRAEQMCVKVPEGGLRDFAILSDSDDEEDDTSSVTADHGEEKPVMLEDTDEEEEVVEEEPSPQPEKKKVRKRVKKVKVSDE
tara:strand:+ start:33 stop:920 length:888 start_codon:yes stop_codon:yes gene_type:complete